CRAVSKRLFWARGLHHPPARSGGPKPGEEVGLLRPQRARARWRHEAVLRAAARSRRQDLAAWVQVQTQRCKHQGWVLTFLANTHAKRFGFESEMLDRRAVFIITPYSYGGFSGGLLEALPIGWSAGKNADGRLFVQTHSQGANVKVCISKPDIAGRGEVSSATINGKSVDDHAALTGRRVIRRKDYVAI
ncbi:unnamed protein product, partial [Ectocarpus sp. 8 AP-2014]